MKRRREAKHRRSTIGEVLHVTPYKGGGNLSEVSAEQLALKAAKRQDLISNKKIDAVRRRRNQRGAVEKKNVRAPKMKMRRFSELDML